MARILHKFFKPKDGMLTAYIKKPKPEDWIRADFLKTVEALKKMSVGNIQTIRKMPSVATHTLESCNCYMTCECDYNHRWVRKDKAVGRPAKPFGDAIAFGKALMSRGFKLLGQGAFSKVYGKDGKDRVIKVTHREDNWIDYVLWASQKGQAGKFAPKAFSYKKVMGKFSVTVMERLDMTAHKLREKDDLYLMQGLISTHLRGNVMAGLFLEELSPGCADFATELKAKFGKERLDLHGGNYMIRADGTFVFTDPVCDSDVKTKSTRLKAGDFTPVSLPFLIRVLSIESCYRH